MRGHRRRERLAPTDAPTNLIEAISIRRRRHRSCGRKRARERQTCREQSSDRPGDVDQRLSMGSNPAGRC